MRTKLCQNVIMNNEIEFELETEYEILGEIVMFLDEMILNGIVTFLDDLVLNEIVVYLKKLVSELALLFLVL